MDGRLASDDVLEHAGLILAMLQRLAMLVHRLLHKHAVSGNFVATTHILPGSAQHSLSLPQAKITRPETKSAVVAEAVMRQLAVSKQENGAAAAEPRGLVKGEVDGGSTGVVDGHTGDAPEDGPGCDPFLRALTRGGDPKALKLFAGAQAELDAKATEAEQALRRRADATKAALAALLQRMDADRQRFESRLADAAPAETAEDLRR